MPGLTIGWEYLTGYAVATDPSNRERAEWPPHPGRVFMAMAAAWFETGEDAAEGEALRWLETLGDPELCLPASQASSERLSVKTFVPVNGNKASDTFPSKKQAWLQSAPAISRIRQERKFPRRYIGNETCFMYWPEAKGIEQHREALDRLCGRVTRIGHSSSLVRMWVADDARLNNSTGERLIPDEQLADQHTRSISAGMLAMLVEQYGQAARRQHAEITEQVDALKASKKAVKGKGAKQRKAAIDAEIEALGEQLSDIVPRPPVRPIIGLWSGYRKADAIKAVDGQAQSLFDTDLLVLTQTGGPRLPAVSTLAVTRALRGAVMKASGIQPVPPWVSGHQTDGSPCDDDSGHLAFVPLPDVGHEHADGHLLGVGLVFPRSVDRRERGRVLGPLLMKSDGQPEEVELTLGRLGVWTIKKRDWREPRRAMQPETWTLHPSGAKTWASVTPVVLDRFPKSDRTNDRAGWIEEVAGILRNACVRIGLPEPLEVDIDTTCWHRGGPRAVGKRRPLRGEPATAGSSAALGDGFPFYPAKGTNASRPQVHAWLSFAEPIVGPVILGAGRYMGYGLFKPWEAR